MAKEIIKRLGGVKAVAAAINASPSAVANWQLPDRDIPWRRRHEIARLAADRGVPLPSDFWGSAA